MNTIVARLRRPLAVAAAAMAAVAVVPTAFAGVTPWQGQTTDVPTACEPVKTFKVFKAWGDNSQYFLAPNGGLEAGVQGWKLEPGATVAMGNEPFFLNSKRDLSLLALAT
ncbi:MAG: hypothetical protein FJW96_14035, partial [Actinobacteria bacterium]|nr:hypothetical protein [Actinomycetota bacterium]